MTDYTTTYNILYNQNQALTSTLQNINTLYSTDDQKSKYQSSQTETVNTFMYVFYFIYFALLIVIAFILLFNFQTMSIYYRGAIMAAFIAYPFTIGYIEIIIYITYSYLYSLLNGNVFTNGDW